MVISKLLLQVNLRLSFRLTKIKSILFFVLALLTKLNAYIAETNYSWDGQVLEDEVITWRPAGAWDLTTAQSFEFGVSYYLRNTEFGSAIITVTENMYISQNLSEWVDGQIDGQANTVPAESEWISEFTTQNGYLAKAIYQEKPFGFSTNQTKVALAAKKTNSDYNVAVTFTITSNGPKSLDDIKSLVGNFTLNKISGNQENTSNLDSSSNDASTDDSTTPSGNGNSTDSGNYDQIVTITCGDTMQHDVKSFEVKSGSKVKLVLKHSGSIPKIAMGHNLILLKKGKTALSFGQETLAAGGNASNPLPEAVKIDVIANTKLLGPGESDSFIFTAPSELGIYEYLCTFPGHFAMERGLMTVTQGSVSNGSSGNSGNQNSSSIDQPSNTKTIKSVFSNADMGNNWSLSPWFGYSWTGSNNLWIYHTLLGWLYIHLNDDNSVWMYSPSLSPIPFWLWTRPDVFPYLYLIPAGSNEVSDGFWVHLDIKSGLIRNWINQSWDKFIDLLGNDTSSNNSSNNNSSNNSSNSAESDISSNTQKASLLSAGEASTLVVLDDGTLWVSGSNYYSGKLRTTPTEPNTFKKIDNGPVTHVQSYGTKTYFIKQDQTLWGLGSNINGIPSTATTVPTQILNPDKPQDWTGYTGLAVGYNHAVFTKSDGKLYGIGDSSVGQLGFDEYMNSAIPMTKQTRPFPIEIPVTNPGIPVAGGSHTLYYNLFGQLWGSGDNTNGQLGDGTTINKMSFAKIIDSGVSSVSTNSGHTLFVKSDGSLWGMGSNWSGALGDGSTTDRISPVQIVNSGVRSSSAGAMHSAFIKTDGSLWVMGAYKGGQMADSTTPVKIVNSDVSTVSCGVGFTVFLKTDGSLWGLGANGFGQLGLDAENPQLTPLELFKFPISSAPSSNESSDNSSGTGTDSSDTTSNDNTDTSTDNSDTPPTDNSDTGDDNQNNDSSIIPPEFIWPNEELDLLALDEFMKSQNHQYKKQASGETVAEVSYDSSWDISRDRRADKYPSFNGVLQSYSPMRYTEINIDDPNGYNDILHSDIQGPFGDGWYFLEYDERALSTKQKEDEVIAINGTEYSAYVYEIKEVIMFFSSIPPGDPEGLPIDSRTDYYEDRTRTLWVNKEKGLLKWTEENILYSETYGMGSAASPYIDDAYSYTLILDPTAVPSIPLNWDEDYQLWIKNPEPYGGTEALALIKEAKENSNESFSLDSTPEEAQEVLASMGQRVILNISDISPLKHLTSLTTLSITSDYITDLSPIKVLKNLKNLTISRHIAGNDLSNLSDLDIEPISRLDNLTSLTLLRNNVTDVNPINALKDLIVVDFKNNKITDLSGFSGLSNLTSINLNYNQISDISPLSDLTNLTTLHLANNQISDLSGLSALTNLTTLHLSNNQITDIGPLSALTNLTTLHLSNNQISDLSGLSALTNLESLYLSENQISDLNPLANLETLKTLTVHDNLSLSLTPLLDIPGLFVHRKPGTVFLPGSTNALDTPYIFLH